MLPRHEAAHGRAVDEHGLVCLHELILRRLHERAERGHVVRPDLRDAVVGRLALGIDGRQRVRLHVAADARQPGHHVGVTRQPVRLEIADRHSRLPLEEHDRFDHRLASAPPPSEERDAGERPQEAGHVGAHPVDGAAAVARTAARAGDHVEVAQIVAAEADAGDHRQRDGHVAGARGRRARRPRPRRRARRRPRRSRPMRPRARRARVDLARADAMARPSRRRSRRSAHHAGARIAVVEAPAVRREPEAVGQQ